MLIWIRRPGFNDTFRSETEVLQDISHWLQEQYQKDYKLAGILYLHSINHARVEGSALRNLKMFRELCGPEALKNIVLATTFWSEVERRIGEGREAELASKEAFWGGMLGRGSRMARFTDRESGLDILSNLIGLSPQPLKIQRELVEQDIALVDTGAGRMVNQELARLEEKHQQELVQLRADMDDAMRDKDAEVQEILRAQEEKIEARMNKVHRQQEQLRADRRAETRRMQGEIEKARFERNQEVSNLKESIEQLQREVSRRDHTHKLQFERFEESSTNQDVRIQQLKAYNEQAQKRFEGLDIDEVIARVRADESKLRVEEREKLEAEIQKAKNSGTAKKRSKAITIFFNVLRVALPLGSLLTLGVPIMIPGLSSDTEPEF
jgi:hypothetical protein